MSPPERPVERRLSWWQLAGRGLVLVVLAAYGVQYLRSCSGSASPLVGQSAPAFETSIVAGEGASTDRVSLESLRGRVVLLDFWASWCGPCRASIPIVSTLAARHRAAGLVTLGVNIESERPLSFVVRAHDALGAGFPTVRDEGLRMQSAFGVQSIPTLVLIDRRGVVRRYEVGVPSERDLDAEVLGMLEELP